MAECCVLKLGVIWREIAELKPNVVVSYTYSLFPTTLEDVPVALAGSLVELTPQNHRVKCRGKQLGWWERICRTAWTDHLRILVVGHPERMARIEYVQLLTSWLRLESPTLI